MVIEALRKTLRGRWGRRGLAVAPALLALAAACVLWLAYDADYAIASWLFWRYAQLWLWLILWSAACASFGQLLLVRVLRSGDDLAALESAVSGMLLGTIAFVMAMYAAGAVGAYGPVFAVALPVVFLAAGARPGLSLWRRLRGELAAARFGLPAALAGGAGLFFLALTYLRALTPDALGFDAVWFHVKIAQDYARWQRIGPFPGDYSHALPHLSSLLYTWGYLLPGLHTAQRWIFALQMELCVLLWTLAGISAVVARQLSAPAPRSSWAAFFLFPGFFVYGLWGTADHIIGFFSIGIALALLQLYQRATPAAFVLLATGIAGGVLTKYQAIYAAIPALALAAIAWALGWWRLTRAAPRAPATTEGQAEGESETIPLPPPPPPPLPTPPPTRRELRRGPILLVAVGCALSAPHFVKNLIFHHNPVYPFAQEVFSHSTPVVTDGALYFDHGMKPQSGTPVAIGDRLANVVRLMTVVSLMPRDGSPALCTLFVLLLPAAALAGRRREALVVAALGLGSMVMWAMLLLDTRHLEAFIPILAAATAAMIVKLWRLGLVARVGLVPLLALQIAWAADAPFTGGLQSGVHLIQRGFERSGTRVFNEYRASYVALGKATPPNAKLLIHTFGLSLGINRDIVMDSMGFQGLIDYHAMRTPRQLYDRLHALGITYTVHEAAGNYPSPTMQEDVLFHTLVARHGLPTGRFDQMVLTALPPRPPPAEAPYNVLTLDLRHGYPDGLYPIAELSDWIVRPSDRSGPARATQVVTPENQIALLQAADAVLGTPAHRLTPAAAMVLDRRFRAISGHLGDWTLYVKR